jgi:hypothetical protein
MERYFRKNNNRRSRSQLDFIIQGLMVSNKSHFFALLYQAMIEHPSYVILSDMPIDRKFNLLDEMMEYYESHEDYEKCAKLLKIQKEVK